MSSGSYTHWCLRCRQPIRPRGATCHCPNCGGGFVEELDDMVGARSNIEDDPHFGLMDPFPDPRFGIMDALAASMRQRMAGRNPNIDIRTRHRRPNFDDLMGPGLQQLIEQLGMNDRQGPSPAPRSAIDALRRVRITQRHLNIDSHCVVCQDNFELGSEARQMPCMHLYHSDCITKWLVRSSSCPLCRLELPSRAFGSAPGNWNARTGNVSSGSHNSSSRETSSQNQGSRNPFAVAGRRLVLPFDSSNQNTGNLSERGGGSSSTTPYEENNEANYPRDTFNY